MISIILDLLVVAIVILSAVLAYRKGFVKALFSLVGGIIAIVLAITFSAPVAAWLDAAYVGPAVQNSVVSAIKGEPLEKGDENALASVDISQEMIEMPDSLRSVLESLNIDVEDAMALAEKNRADTVAARQQLIREITAPISETISKAIALIGLMLVFFLLLFLVSRLLNLIFKLLPFGKGFNRFGGLLLGIARGILFAMLFGLIAYWLAKGNVLISQDDIAKTYVLKWIDSINPILKLFA